MSQKLKLSDSELKNYVKNIINEEAEATSENDDTIVDRLPTGNGAKLTLAIDGKGKFYVIKDANTDNPQVVYRQP